MKTREQGVAEWNRVVPAWEQWLREHPHAYPSSIQSLRPQTISLINEAPNAELVRQGRDLALLYELWWDIYRQEVPKAEPWNDFINPSACETIQTLNIFTGQCNDLPDWRTSEQRSRDEVLPHRIEAKRVGEAAYIAAKKSGQAEGLSYREAIDRGKEARKKAERSYLTEHDIVND